MRHHRFISITLVLLAAPVFSSVAQADEPVEVWRQDATYFGGAAVDSQGNTFAGGNNATTKIAPDGTVLWTQPFTLTPAGDTYLKWTAVDSQDNVIRGGFVENFAWSYLVVKYDPDGNYLWHNFATVGAGPQAIRCEVDEFDDIYVFGETVLPPTVFHQFLTVKFSAAGNVEWSRTLDIGNEPKSLAVRGGQVVASGEGANRFITVSYDYDGNERWRGIYSGNIGALDVAIGPLGQVAVCGWSRIPGTTTNAGTVVQYDSAGNESWVAYHNSPVGTDIFRKIAIGADGSVVAVGSGLTAAADDAWSTIRLDSLGNLQWARLNDQIGWNASGGLEYARCVSIHPSGSIYVGGPSVRPCSTAGMEGHIIKYTQDGEVEWDRPMGSVQDCLSHTPTRLLFDASSGALITYSDWQVFRFREPVGTDYCGPGTPHSGGMSATLIGTGSSLAKSGELTLNASQLPPNQFGFFLGATMQGLFPNPGGSQGNLCLAGSIARFNTQVQNSGSTGSFSIPVDLAHIPTNPAQAVLAGETWNFQAWFRDQNPGPTSNFTNAVSITFQ